MRTIRYLPLGTLVAAGLGGGVSARAAHFTTGATTAVKFGVHEIVLTGDGSAANPFDTIATVTFVPPSGGEQTKTVHAFYDGDHTWRVRVYVSETGAWRWSSACATDKRLDGQTGTFKAIDSKLHGRLLPHPKNPRHWATEDGRWFLNIADTAYFLLGAKDEIGQPIPDEDMAAYVRDAVSHGVTSFMAYAVPGPGSWAEEGNWTETYFADAGLTRRRLDNFRFSDRRLRWLLDHHPDGRPRNDSVSVRCPAWGRRAVLEEAHGRTEGTDPSLHGRALRRVSADLLARRQSRPLRQRLPQQQCVVREVGEYLRQHDLWQHPISTGHARRVQFHFADEDWATYLHPGKPIWRSGSFFPAREVRAPASPRSPARRLRHARVSLTAAALYGVGRAAIDFGARKVRTHQVRRFHVKAHRCGAEREWRRYRESPGAAGRPGPAGRVDPAPGHFIEVRPYGSAFVLPVAHASVRGAMSFD
jgi:hypothetical protein